MLDDRALVRTRPGPATVSAAANEERSHQRPPDNSVAAHTTARKPAGDRAMYHDEIHHLGRPHLHARYGDDEASLTIETGEVLAGGLPPRALRLVRDWASNHQEERQESWDRAAGMSRCAGEALRFV
jgi:hypothetical protein